MKTLKEYILEAIQNTVIFEMAYERKELKKLVNGLIRQIIENWCLVRYCTLYDNSNINKSHWKRELETHMYNIFDTQIKGGNYQAKYNLIYQIVIDEMEYTTSNKIAICIRKKFKKEQLNIDNTICNECVESLIKIIELLSNKITEHNYDKIDEFIENI